MSDWLLDIDFESTVRDFDYTKRAEQKLRNVVDSEAFEDADAETIFHHLFRNMELVSFKDYLKRYIYERSGMSEPFADVPDKVYQEIIIDSFKENCAPQSFSPTTKKWSATVKGWLTSDTVRRKTIFLLGFGLRMTAADVTIFLTKVLKEGDFNFSDPEEVVFWFCYQNQYGYPKAEEILQQYRAMDSRAGNQKTSDLLRIRGFSLEEESCLLQYLGCLKGEDPEKGETAAEQCFRKLYGRTQQVIAAMYQQDEEESGSGRQWHAEDISPADVEKVICCGIPLTQNGNLQKTSASLLGRHFDNRRMSRQRIDSILKKNVSVERFDIITLMFFLYSQREELLDPIERYELFVDEVNRDLKECGMMEIYPVNPYEAFILMCLLTECPLAVYSEIWEMSYQN